MCTAPSPGQLDPQAEPLALLHVASPSTPPRSLAMLVSLPPLTIRSFRPAHTHPVHSPAAASPCSYTYPQLVKLLLPACLQLVQAAAYLHHLKLNAAAGLALHSKALPQAVKLRRRKRRHALLACSRYVSRCNTLRHDYFLPTTCCSNHALLPAAATCCSVHGTIHPASCVLVPSGPVLRVMQAGEMFRLADHLQTALCSAAHHAWNAACWS